MPLVTIRIERRTPARPRARRRNAVLAAAAAASALAGVFLVSAPAQADIVSVPAKTVQSNTVVAADRSVSPVVIGGSTTVPTDATRVQFSVTVSREVDAGTLAAYPAGTGPSSGDTLPFAKSSSTSAEFVEQVGASNKVTFLNQSAGSITLTVRITGYSTEVRASDISALGGSPGQVLTNNGNSATWTTPGSAYGLLNNLTSTEIGPGTATTLASIPLPAGSYAVSFEVTAHSTAATPDTVQCYVFGPSGQQAAATTYASVSSAAPYASLSAQGLVAVDSDGGKAFASCLADLPSTKVYYPTFIATPVGTTKGTLVH
jgi:hypothetical protein